MRVPCYVRVCRGNLTCPDAGVWEGNLTCPDAGVSAVLGEGVVQAADSGGGSPGPV